MDFDVSEDQMVEIMDQLGAGEALRGMFARAQKAGAPLPIAELPSFLACLSIGIADFAEELGATVAEAQTLGEVASARAERDFWGLA
ncbi:MAG: hypothetical protein KKB66_18440 [Alphaproteobacteria bacterium]|uniref:Uncharacterized protein n=1 Tax=viral metagenome TaxID=1070528 RepID=A0A6H1ZH72_9ZZZZ|nr:hypothetical protein [Alphaproteobacteria bacterium]MBU0803583.1 hypothetical protein [Alphaproteobacteria bacterium]MBU0873120.1 hypothetical protein [Alphaproteobacteria bacterium]MBU1402510.1 hypothetical protein [Alphaproteobacteria bacterium]MBU1593152.1 hypothetical protein [Alphaproteobacteria bacterium]